MKVLGRVQYPWRSRTFPAAKAHCYFHDLLVIAVKQVLPANSFIAFRYEILSTREVLLVSQNQTHPVMKVQSWHNASMLNV